MIIRNRATGLLLALGLLCAGTAIGQEAKRDEARHMRYFILGDGAAISMTQEIRHDRVSAGGAVPVHRSVRPARRTHMG